MDSHNIMFIILAAVIACSSLACVLSKSIIRAATYLFFALLGTAGLYFLMGYTFLGSVQVMVYAGGVVVLYVFAIFKQEFLASSLDAPDENVLPIKEVGVSMLSTDFNGYLLPFEAVSVLLLACIVAALLIARKR